MARPRTFDPNTVLDAATRLFWERGYEATSVQDLVDALGVNRASLYGTFGDKDRLFEAVLERYSQRSRAELAARLAPPHAGREAVASYLAAAIALATRTPGARGCLMVNTAVGCTSAPPRLLERAFSAVRGSAEAITAALRRDERLAGRSDLRALGRFFTAQAHGLAVLARAGAKRAQLDEAAEIALRVLDAPEPIAGKRPG